MAAGSDGGGAGGRAAAGGAEIAGPGDGDVATLMVVSGDTEDWGPGTLGEDGGL